MEKLIGYLVVVISAALAAQVLVGDRLHDRLWDDPAKTSAATVTDTVTVSGPAKRPPDRVVTPPRKATTLPITVVTVTEREIVPGPVVTVTERGEPVVVRGPTRTVVKETAAETVPGATETVPGPTVTVLESVSTPTTTPTAPTPPPVCNPPNGKPKDPPCPPGHNK